VKKSKTMGKWEITNLKAIKHCVYKVYSYVMFFSVFCEILGNIGTKYTILLKNHQKNLGKNHFFVYL
jgi:hypothetical protein